MTLLEGIRVGPSEDHMDMIREKLKLLVETFRPTVDTTDHERVVLFVSLAVHYIHSAGAMSTFEHSESHDVYKLVDTLSEIEEEVIERIINNEMYLKELFS